MRRRGERRGEEAAGGAGAGHRDWELCSQLESWQSSLFLTDL